MDTTKVSIDRVVDKEDMVCVCVRVCVCVCVCVCVYAYDGILLSHKKEWNWVICRDVDGPRACHTE